MKKVFLLSWVIPFFSSVILAQEVNSDYYRFGATPAAIPSVLQGFNTNNGHFFFGISDPGLDSATSILQAYKRAQVLACMAQGVDVKNYTAGFLSEAYRGSDGTYQSMVELAVSSTKAPVLIIIDTVFTLLQEAVLIVQPDNEQDSVDLDFSVNRYNVEYQWSGRSEYSEQIEMYIDDKLTSPETLVFMKYGDMEEVYTTVGEDLFPLPRTRYQYVAEGDSMPQVYRYGLWVNILRELNLALGSYSRLVSEQIRGMDQVYENMDNLNEGLSRNRLSFDITNMQFKDSQIEIVFDIKPIR